CRGFTKRINLTALNHNGQGTTTLNTSISAGPAPIIRATATVVAAYRKVNGSKQCNPTGWLPVSGEIVSPPATFAGLPLNLPPAPFGTPPPPSYRDAIWGTLPSGVNV